MENHPLILSLLNINDGSSLRLVLGPSPAHAEPQNKGDGQVGFNLHLCLIYTRPKYENCVK